jgi:hypothetical protein
MVKGSREEKVGFEPTDPFEPPVFKTGVIDHSTTSQVFRRECALLPHKVIFMRFTYRESLYHP